MWQTISTISTAVNTNSKTQLMIPTLISRKKCSYW